MATLDLMDVQLRELLLVESQRMAQRVFALVESAGVIAPGRSEREAGERIAESARAVFGERADQGVGRLVRSGPNTLVGGRWPGRVIGLEDVVVVDRHDGQSRFRRLETKNLAEWLKEYTLGELWQKNVIDGGPVIE